MANLTLRIPKAAPLTTNEVDNNFINLNADGLLATKNSKPWVASTAYTLGEILNVLDRFYLVTTAGTTGTVAPSHLGGTIANGTTQLLYALPTNYDARDVLNKLLTVDGSGSGLDADTLDGLNTASTNTASTIVARDASGNFAAGTITASLTGNVTGTASNADLLDGLNSASTNTASTIVARDASGNFAAGTITASLTGTAANASALGGLTSQQILDEALASSLAVAIALG